MIEITPPISVENQGQILAFPAQQTVLSVKTERPAPVAIELPPLGASLAEPVASRPARGKARYWWAGVAGLLLSVAAAGFETARNVAYGWESTWAHAAVFGLFGVGMIATPVIVKMAGVGYDAWSRALKYTCYAVTAWCGLCFFADDITKALSHTQQAAAAYEQAKARASDASAERAGILAERAGILADIKTAEAERRAAQERADAVKVSGTAADLEARAKAARRAANLCERSCRPQEKAAADATAAADLAKARDAEQAKANAASTRKAALERRVDELDAKAGRLEKRGDDASEMAKAGPAEMPGKVRLIAMSAGMSDAQASAYVALGEPLFLVFGMLLFVALNEPALRCLTRYYAPGEAVEANAAATAKAAPAPTSRLARLAAMPVRAPLTTIRASRELASLERAKAKAEAERIAAAAAAERDAMQAAELDRKAAEAARETVAELAPADKARAMLAEIFTAGAARMNTKEIKAAFATAWDVRHAETPNPLTDMMIREVFTGRGFQFERKGGSSGWFVAVA